MKCNKTILLHICCGPCSIAPIKYLSGLYNVKGYFYNPNIHPYKEFAKRLDSAEKMGRLMNTEIIFDRNYYLNEFLGQVGQDINNRCEKCYRMRLGKTAQKAQEIGADYFTTTLLISPYQNREKVIMAGENASRLWGVPFLKVNFRAEFRESKAAARDMGLYTQGYCGCIFSEKERYYRPGSN